MSRAPRRRTTSRKRKEVLSIALPAGELLIGRPDDGARKLLTHLQATDPDPAERLAIRTAAPAWTSKQQRKASAKEKHKARRS